MKAARRSADDAQHVIAAGARPFVPPLPGLDAVGYVTSDTLWDALASHVARPQRLRPSRRRDRSAASSRRRSPARLSGRHRRNGARLLAREDDEISALVRAALAADGVEVLTGHAAKRCERGSPGEAGESKWLIVAHDETERPIPFDMLLVAVGRSARLAGYGLEALGIPAERTVTTNEYLETLYPNIFAAGDVAGPYQFTHTAAHMAWYATVNALFGSLRKFRVDYSTVPAAAFVDPEVARVGPELTRSDRARSPRLKYALDSELDARLRRDSRASSMC